MESNPDNVEVLEELGKAYLRADKVDDAVSCFTEAVMNDPRKAYLFLDLSIYHTFSAMQAGKDKALFNQQVALGDAAVTRYLNTNPIQPMEAYALGVQSKYKSFSGNKKLGQELFQKAGALDPYFSKAT